MGEIQIHNKLAVPPRPLLTTKLYTPRMRGDAVVRSRLIDRLNAAHSAGAAPPKLTLITGPAGYGKTTLAAQWINQLPQAAAWLSLDSGDNDKARFLAYLFAAIAAVREEIGESALARLTTTYLYNETEAILTALLNDLALVEEAVVIVLDDYHLITADAVHQVLTFILQHMPLTLHLVILSRSEPPLPVALLRGQGQLHCLNAHDLRFTAAETAAFLQHTMSLTVNPEQITEIDEQVEGWVTGLQLIALALQEAVTLPQAFSGSQRYLVDYLADQVLHRQPETIQAFLLETAVLSQFNADLCQHVTGLVSRPILTQIEAANLFLVPLDAERNWYRYHHLFADFLYGRLQQQKNSADIEHLHQRAAHWYHDHGQSLLAVDHALKAGDYPFAARLMADVARDVLMFGEGSTLRQWVEALPAALQTAQPRLSLFYIWSLIRTGAFAQAKTLLEEISDRLDSALLWGEWAALRARLAAITGETDLNIRFSQKALAKLPGDQHMLRSEVAINLGFSHLQREDVDAARSAFAEAAQNNTHDPGLWAVMFATYYWGQTYERQADLPAAYDIYQHGLHLAETQAPGRPSSAAVGFMHVALGRVLYEWNRLAEAETHLRRALACAQRSGDHKMLIYSRESLAQLLATLGDQTTAQALLADLAQQIGATQPLTGTARLALQRGDLAPVQQWATVEQWATAMGYSLADPPEKVTAWPAAYLLLVRLRLAQREFSGVLATLDILRRHAEQRQATSFLIEVLLHEAVALAKMGDMETAVSRLQRSLTLAEPGGLIRTFLDGADPILARLLHRLAHNGVTADYARTLLTHLQPQVPLPEAEVDLEPLSPRELEVLHHLAAGLTNRQIAAEMVISLNTVKSHTRRLYDKLGVSSRTQAVAQARAHHLLDFTP
ncbi:MAG: LuxR C-terminal-related transcriptional regulator [Chloroflexota bacterium]